MGHVQLHTVKTGLPGPDGAVYKLAFALFDIFVGKILDGLFPARANRLLHIMDELDGHLAALGVHGVRHLFESGDKLIVADTEEVGTLPVKHTAGLDVDETKAALRARHMALDQRVGDEAHLVGEAGYGGKPYKAISEFEVSKFYGL